MSNLLKAFTSTKGFLNALYAWIFPSVLVVGISYFIAVWLDGTWSRALDAFKSHTLLTSIFLLGTAGGLVLDAVSTPLYRLLEGYSWPDFARKWGIRRQLGKKAWLEQRVEHLIGWRRQITQERLARFPDDPQQTLPTALGNRFRALETYARQRYGIDSQLLWSELCSVAPQSVQDELADARTGIDLFVATAYLTVLAAAAVVGFGLFAGWSLLALLFYGAGSLLVACGCYRLAVVATDGLAQAVQALVNVTRGQLATVLGLDMPASLDQECRMWRLVNLLVYGALTDEERIELDQFRTKKPAPSHAVGSSARPAPNRPKR